jgi:arylsulfatase A-like enzyme
MSPQRFIVATLCLSLVIVGLAHLVKTEKESDPERLTGLGGPPSWHYFVPEARSFDRIECPLTDLPEIASTWGREIAPCTLIQGWTPPNHWGTWAFGDAARVMIDTGPASERTLFLRARANPDIPPEDRQVIGLEVNGIELGSGEVGQKWTTLHFEIPQSVLVNGVNEFALTFTAGISPHEAHGTKDHRKLAAGIGELRLTSVSPSETGVSPPKTNAWDADRRSFVIEHSGTLVLPIQVPEDADDIELQIRASTSVAPKSLAISITIENIEGNDRHTRAVTEKKIKRGRRIRLPVDNYAGGWAILALETVIDGGRLEIQPVQFFRDPEGSNEQSAEPVADPAGTPPDIVLITLDAARADRFSFSGHHRKTSPFIDRLALDSIVFPHAYSLVPYTLCSVPTMITGLSFLDHRVIGHEDVLSQDAVTLAESLRAMGYQTVAFSATPNNSIAKGFDQGYEEFHEVWHDGPRRQTRRAHFIARRAADWLDAHSDDSRPLHLQVHMVPPHAPYDPPPVMDIFTDPGYRGPCKGFHKTLALLDGGGMEATTDCLDHLLGLYDGNILTADAATEVILNALRRRPRWDNTVVLITSDHGEAFFDHYRMDHNSTLFTEMLHVPFVLKMPADFDASTVATDRLVTLADITPTLLGAAGLHLPSVTEGINLLDSSQVNRDRHMVTRTATTPPTYGLRTIHWSAMVGARGLASLYDLRIDPDEQHNLHLELPARVAGLGGILNHRLQQPPRIQVSVDTADITDEERELLETLGYIR